MPSLGFGLGPGSGLGGDAGAAANPQQGVMALKLALQVDPANASTGFPGNPNVGDIYLDPTTSQCRLTATLSEAVAQLLYTRFRMFQGEWFLDPTLGTPYYQQILGVKNSTLLVQQILRQVVISCPGVKALQSFSASVAARSMTVNFACKLTDDTVLTSQQIPPFKIPLP